MNKKAATVIESKYKKVIEAQKEGKEACDNLNEAGTIKQSDIDYSR